MCWAFVVLPTYSLFPYHLYMSSQFSFRNPLTPLLSIHRMLILTPGSKDDSVIHQQIIIQQHPGHCYWPRYGHVTDNPWI